ncbi:MAG: hypothetical protein RQ867_01420 [Mariprofundaceae bacterium]|nr:hypothetical protein [Mariprofundaceae bacterium]
MDTPDLRLRRSLAAWGSPDFKATLKHELEQLDVLQLPLVQGMTQGSVPLEGSVEVTILKACETDNAIRARAGIFYNSIIAGCSCADDPTPVDERNEYCEIQLDIDKATAETTVTLLPA